MGFIHRFEDGLDFVSGPGIEMAVSRKGAELAGLTVSDGNRRVPLVWRNMQVSPPEDGFWRRHAPILFPIVGGIHENRSVTTAGDQVHFPGLHGFFRHTVVDLAAARQDGDRFVLKYALAADSRTMEMYPWKFSMSVVYSIGVDGFDLSFSVVNEDSRPMSFQIGWHPGINVPLVSGNKQGCHVRLPAGHVVRMMNDENCYLTGESEVFDTAGDFRFNEEDLQATYMFDVSAVRPADRFVDVLDADMAAGVRVGFPDFPHLGVWSDAGAPFICVEPWQGMDDTVDAEPFDKKFGMVMLKPGAVDRRTAYIRFLNSGLVKK